MEVGPETRVTSDLVLYLSSSATVVVTAPATFQNPASFGDEIARYSDSASAGVVAAADMQSRPARRPGDILEAVPGLAVSQHSGEGKANQYYLRGFDLGNEEIGIGVAVAVRVRRQVHGRAGDGDRDVRAVITR